MTEIGVQCYNSKNLDVSTQSDGPHTVDFTCQFDGVDLKDELDDLPHPFILQKHAETIEILSVLDVDHTTYVKLKVVISKSGHVTIFVHDKLLNDNNPVWLNAQRYVFTKKDVLNVLACLSNFNVCIGNPDEEFQSLVPVGGGISVSNDDTIVAYREKNFNAVQGKIKYDSTIRSSNCTLLVSGQKCSACHLRRKLLKQRYDRHKSLTKREFDFNKCTFKHSDMPREVLVKKIEWQRNQINFLQAKADRLERQLKQKISKEGVKVNEIQDLELKDLMATCEKDVIQAYPDSSCLQRLFSSQQLKSIQNTKTGMRWHPMIIRWCLAIRHKSQVAYDTIREAGFITLPSNRTLFDYSHHIKSDLGLNADSLKLLKNEAEKQGMYHEEWRKYIGILFDEVKVKEDLVYDRVSGELIGYCNLDEVGNAIINLENVICGQENEVAKYVLVLMVRSVTTSLKFPLAAYATQSITSDFLYPIIWNSIAVLEVHLELKVLFLTCDGASANRKFFDLHKFPGHKSVYFSNNPFCDQRKIYFISDVPHLIKTTRNCFSNSSSHKNSRQLWKHGKDISWMHIVRLFEEHCEYNMYNPCPKLSRRHIDLNAFSYMKVNLAAQVLSDSVAYALEDNYNQHVSETVCFLRVMNKFFDVLNVRSLFEGRNKRNQNLDPFRSSTDERLDWLTNDFLDYFKAWEESVETRHGQFSKKDRSKMILSQQTLNGLRMTVMSVTECIKEVLDMGADFVLTCVFNQDPLEQHFSQYRHKGGANKNPTVNEVRHILTNIRTIGAQCLPAYNGSTQVMMEPIEIDNSKLPRRQST